MNDQCGKIHSEVVTCSQEVSNQLEVFRKELAAIKQDLAQRKDNSNPVPQEVWSDIVNKIIPQEVSNKMSDVTAGMAELQQKTGQCRRRDKSRKR